MIEIRKDLSVRELRLFALLLVVFCGVVGAGVLRGTGSAAAAGAIWGAALAVAAAGLMWPSLLRWTYVGMTAAVFPIGWVVSRVLLAIIFYGILTPIGLARRLLGRDPLQRRWSASQDSYLVPHVQPDRMDRYFRQF